MARVTVEDCLENVENRFELVLVASKRARQLANGRETGLDWDNDKPTVLALREIAEGHVTADILQEAPEKKADEVVVEEELDAAAFDEEESPVAAAEAGNASESVAEPASGESVPDESSEGE